MPRLVSSSSLLVVALSLACAPDQAAQQVCASLPFSLFAYDTSAPLDLQDSLVSVRDSVEIHAISFASPRGGRATGFLFVPVRVSRARIPGVVVQHGMPGRAENVMRDAGNIARHGAVTLALDAPWNHRSGGVVRFTEADSAEQVQLIVNLRRAFDVLLARPDVDPHKLAYTGRSYGGAMGGLLAGVEHRPVGYVLIVGDGGLVAHFTDGAGDMDLARFGQALSGPGQAERWLAAMRPIEPIRFLPCARSRLLFLSGRTDQLVTEEDALAYQAAAPEPKTVKWYNAGHGLETAAKTDELNWLHETIGTAPAGSPESWWH